MSFILVLDDCDPFMSLWFFYVGHGEDRISFYMISSSLLVFSSHEFSSFVIGDLAYSSWGWRK